MALIKCPECGKEISDTINNCIHCGYVIKQEPAKIKKEKTKKKFNPILFIIPSVIVLITLIIILIFGILFLPPYVKKNNKYKEGVTLLSEGNYSNAKDIFFELEDFKDSEEKRKECFYYLGKKHLNSGDYLSAVSCFEHAGDYLDALELAKDASNKHEKATAEKEAANEAQRKEQEKLTKLQEAYDSCSSSRIKLTDDGKSIVADSKNKYDTDTYYDILKIIRKLDLPSSLEDSMNTTNALMGKQTESYDDYEVSWSYHPDNGLDVIFSVK